MTPQIFEACLHLNLTWSPSSSIQTSLEGGGLIGRPRPILGASCGRSDSLSRTRTLQWGVGDRIDLWNRHQAHAPLGELQIIYAFQGVGHLLRLLEGRLSWERDGVLLPRMARAGHVIGAVTDPVE